MESAFRLRNLLEFPTRKDSFLDKIFTSDKSYIEAQCSKHAPLGKSDHACVLVDNVLHRKVEYYNIFKRAVTPDSKRAIQLDLARIDWSILSSIKDLDLKVESYQKIVKDIYEKHCPSKKFRVRSDSDPGWDTPLIQKLRHAKDRSYMKPSYPYFCKTLDLFITKAKQAYYQQNANSLKAGSGNWWKNVKSLESETKATTLLHAG